MGEYDGIDAGVDRVTGGSVADTRKTRIMRIANWMVRSPEDIIESRFRVQPGPPMMVLRVTEGIGATVGLVGRKLVSGGNGWQRACGRESK